MPIPVYAEMSSINPVVLLPSALTPSTAAAFVSSLTLGAGQFCTNPGVLFVPEGAAGDRFLDAVDGYVRDSTGQTMLTDAIGSSFTEHTALVASRPGARERVTGHPGSRNAPAPALLETDATSFAADDQLRIEMFGAAALVVRYADEASLTTALSSLEGQLTASVHGDSQTERTTPQRVIAVLEQGVGRIIFNGWPTGVEVTPAMVHGGPYPATSVGRSTSVGTLAIARFQRPVSYQDFPDELLPTTLRGDNPWHQRRLILGGDES